MKSKRGDGDVVGRVKDWVRRHWASGDEHVLVSELSTNEPGCPDVETVMSILRPEGGRITAKPLGQITEHDVAAARPPA